MQPRSLADFMFIGVVIIPGVFVWCGEIGYALFTFVALLIAACLCGWREQIDAASEPRPDDASTSTAWPQKPRSAGGPFNRGPAGDHDKPGMPR